jgi:iron-sulfur cluster repair protein YtfE (RIC family)
MASWGCSAKGNPLSVAPPLLGTDDKEFPMKATALLEKQHRKVEALFKKLDGGKGDLHAIAIDLATDLAAHMVIEEEIFYPAVKAVKPDLVLESYEEHAIARYALKRLLAADSHAESFAAKVTALKELIEHHVQEEESDLFPKVNKALGEQLEPLGAEMKERFDEMVASGYEEALATAMKSKKTKAANGVARMTAALQR